jgi:hypothetical protein
LLAEKPLAVVGDAHVALKQQLTRGGAVSSGALCANKTGSSAHLSMKPSPALLFVGAHLAAYHGTRRERRNGSTAEAPLTLGRPMLWTPEARRRQMPPRTPPRRPPSLSTAAESVSWPTSPLSVVFSLSHVSFPGRFAQFLGSSLLA